MPTLSPELVLQAQQRLAGYLHRTPLVHSRTLSEKLGTEVYLKLECLQKTGSFKPRGALNKMLTLTPAERAAGVVATSGGNHAQGLALAAKILGVEATICMPDNTPSNYIDATRGYGAKVVLCPGPAATTVEAMRLKAEGLTFVPPFDDPLVAAGQGTVGLEILQDLPGVTRMYVSIGGGGLISGISTIMKAALPNLRIFGVETKGADAMAQSVEAGKLVELSSITSIARTLGALKVAPMTLAVVQELVEKVIVVEDRDAVQSLIYLLERTKILTEPAAACCLAAAETHRGDFQPGEKIVLLMCGGNVAVSDLCDYYRQFPAAASAS
ncbi:threonine/serine dehydratase [Planctomicrobium sp. SH661]|uniref:threonine/serine dehydratase n=1 Tax=Planctomicrobium sp. SH661 TaxID=3448124 RepID=UPI003F5C7D66